MADYTKYTKQEMQAYAIAKNIKENQDVYKRQVMCWRCRTRRNASLKCAIRPSRRAKS